MPDLVWSGLGRFRWLITGVPDELDALRPTPNGDNRRVYRERNRRSVKFRHRILLAVSHNIGMRRSTDRQVLSATGSSPCLPSRGQTFKLRALLRPAVFTAAAASRVATHIKRPSNGFSFTQSPQQNFAQTVETWDSADYSMPSPYCSWRRSPSPTRGKLAIAGTPWPDGEEVRKTATFSAHAHLYTIDWLSRGCRFWLDV